MAANKEPIELNICKLQAALKEQCRVAELQLQEAREMAATAERQSEEVAQLIARIGSKTK